MAITDWPEDERPRERLLAQGAAALSDAELLALFLRVGVKGQSAVDLARTLIGHFGSLNRLFAASLAEFSAIPGMGPAKYAQLQAVLEMARRHLMESLQRGNALTSPDLTRQYLAAQMRAYPHEVFACLLLDNQHRVIDFRELFRGTIDSASVYPREVVKTALACNAAAVIFAHNHPSGVAEPSRADETITLRLKEALALIDVRLLDHIVIGDGQVVSLAERGVL